MNAPPTTLAVARASWLCGVLALCLLGVPLRAAAQEDDEPSEDSVESPVEQDAEAEDSSEFAAQLAAGLGVGMRNVGLPTTAGERRIATGVFPALDVDVRGESAMSPHVLFGARLRYQTSFGLVGEETPFAGVRRETTLRSHHFDFGVMPAYRFTVSRQGVAIAAFTGWSLRAIRSVRALSIPDFTTHGPTLRLELRIPVSEDVTVRLAPEAIAWIWASGALRNAGVLDTTGFAFGGEASVHVGLSDDLALELTYRGSSGAIASRLGASFTDVEHFVTAQLALLY